MVSRDFDILGAREWLFATMKARCLLIEFVLSRTIRQASQFERSGNSHNHAHARSTCSRRDTYGCGVTREQFIELATSSFRSVSVRSKNTLSRRGR